MWQEQSGKPLVMGLPGHGSNASSASSRSQEPGAQPEPRQENDGVSLHQQRPGAGHSQEGPGPVNEQHSSFPQLRLERQVPLLGQSIVFYVADEAGRPCAGDQSLTPASQETDRICFWFCKAGPDGKQPQQPSGHRPLA